MSKYKNSIEEASSITDMNTSNWNSISPDYVARMSFRSV